MKANFQMIGTVRVQHADAYAKRLANFPKSFLLIDTDRTPPEGYESYTCVDVLGPDFVWMNEAFPKEKFTWYLWFESIFLVTDDMVAFLKLKFE